MFNRSKHHYYTSEKRGYYHPKMAKKSAMNENIIEKYLKCNNKPDRWRMFSRSFHQKRKRSTNWSGKEDARNVYERYLQLVVKFKYIYAGGLGFDFQPAQIGRSRDGCDVSSDPLAAKMGFACRYGRRCNTASIVKI